MFGCPHCAYQGANYSRTLKHILLAHKSESKPVLLPPQAPPAPNSAPSGVCQQGIGQGAQVQQVPLITDAELIKKRQLLESMKLDRELEALKSPNTNKDMFKEMLQLQSKNFEQILKMQQEQSNLAVQLAKLEAGGEGGADWSDDIIKALLPALPELLKQRAAQEAKTGKGVQKEMPKPKKPTAKELEAYKLKIRAGEITYEQFAADAKATYPEVATLKEETMRAEYEKIKAGK